MLCQFPSKQMHHICNGLALGSGLQVRCGKGLDGRPVKIQCAAINMSSVQNRCWLMIVGVIYFPVSWRLS